MDKRVGSRASARNSAREQQNHNQTQFHYSPFSPANPTRSNLLSVILLRLDGEFLANLLYVVDR
jgi:hypothetical protein